MQKLLRRIRYWLRQRHTEVDLVEELESHRAMKQEQLEQTGFSKSEAEYASRRALGNLLLAREDARAVWIWPWLESVLQDVAYAGRSLRRQPGFTSVAVIALASAIGLNTSLATAWSALAWRPWPVQDPERVVNLFNLNDRDLRGRAGGSPWGFSLAEIAYLREHSRTFAGFAAERSGGGDYTLGEEDARAMWVNASYFAALGIPMAVGRGFSPEEDRADAPRAVAVLGNGFWRNHFGEDAALVGKEIRLEDVPFVIVGIAPASFTGTSAGPIDVWMPMASAPLLRPDERWVRNVLQKPESCCVALAGRLQPGVSRRQAQTELALLSRRFRSQSGQEGNEILLTGTQALAAPGANRGIVQSFSLLFAGVTLVLLLACANVGNLLLARAAARRREIAVRLSLGASRSRLLRQLLTESLVLALLAGAIGIAIARWLPRQVFSLAERALLLEPDGPVLGYTLCLCVLACVLFGLAPALHATRSSVAAALKDGARLPGIRVSLRGFLLSMQVAVSVVLLVAAGLLTRGLQRAAQELGFRVHDLKVVTFELPARGYDAARTAAVALQLAQDLSAHAEQRQLALTSTAPLGSGNIKGSFRLPGQAEDQFNSVYEVSPGYFELLGQPVLAGRSFAPSDAGRLGILVNEVMAQRHWGAAGRALGQRVVSGPPWGGWNQAGELEIIGVVRDTQVTNPGSVGPAIYQPLTHRSLPEVLVKTAAADVERAVVAAAKRIDPRLRARVKPAAANLDRQLARARLAAGVAAALGALALMLAVVGLWGVFAYWVQQRTQEIGVRMALGAGAGDVARVVLGASSRAVLIGLALGLAAALASSRLLVSYLYGLSPLDPVAYVGVALVLAVAGLLASYGPARRAAKVDPIAALRCD